MERGTKGRGKRVGLQHKFWRSMFFVSHIGEVGTIVSLDSREALSLRADCIDESTFSKTFFFSSFFFFFSLFGIPVDPQFRSSLISTTYLSRRSFVIGIPVDFVKCTRWLKSFAFALYFPARIQCYALFNIDTYVNDLLNDRKNNKINITC